MWRKKNENHIGLENERVFAVFSYVCKDVLQPHISKAVRYKAQVLSHTPCLYTRYYIYTHACTQVH